MRIDAHQHFWQYNAQRDAWISDDMSAIRRDFFFCDLSHELATNGIDATIAVQADQSETETTFLLDLATQHPQIAGVVGWVDLRSPLVDKRLEHFSQFEKLCGFRHLVQAEPDENFMSREDFQRGIAALAHFGFTYDILIYPRQVPAAIGLVEKFSKQPFIVDHMAKPEIRSQRVEPWAAQMRELAQNPNVFCKVSGLVTEADWHKWSPDDFRPYLDVVFDAFGADRLVFGSDWPVCLVAGTYHGVKRLIEDYLQHVSPADHAKIFGANASQFYGLRADA
jgi:L-fuconolactonase